MKEWQTGAGAIPLEQPLFLGIVNVTPNSMSDGGRFLEPGAAAAQAALLVRQGAGALDLGAESTAPGTAEVPPETEWARLAPVLAALRAEMPQVPLSLDTRHAEVAALGLRSGVTILNDVTGFRAPEMLRLAAAGDCGLIAMRSPAAGVATMPPYGAPLPAEFDNALQELLAVRDRLLGAGIAPERILLDPGFGFGTTFAGDLALWERLGDLPSLLDWPVWRICLGISRKRFLAWRAGTPALPPARRDPLTARAHREALVLGYRVFRTHGAKTPAETS